MLDSTIFNSTGVACDEISPNSSDLLNDIIQTNVGFGLGPISANTDFASTLEDTITTQLGQSEWDNDWTPNIMAM